MLKCVDNVQAYLHNHSTKATTYSLPGSLSFSLSLNSHLLFFSLNTLLAAACKLRCLLPPKLSSDLSAYNRVLVLLLLACWHHFSFKQNTSTSPIPIRMSWGAKTILWLAKRISTCHSTLYEWNISFTYFLLSSTWNERRKKSTMVRRQRVYRYEKPQGSRTKSSFVKHQVTLRENSLRSLRSCSLFFYLATRGQ